MRSARVPANFWMLLGVPPVLGRVFTPEEEQQERVCVLSYQLWKQQFGGSKEVLGTNLVMDGRNYRVIGVMPPEFHFPFPDTKVWEPITAHPYWLTRDRQNPRASSSWLVLGRINLTFSRARGMAEVFERGKAMRARSGEGGGPKRLDYLFSDTLLRGVLRMVAPSCQRAGLLGENQQ